MRSVFDRTLRVLLAGVALLCASLSLAASPLDESVAFDIREQSLENALFELSKQSSYQIVFTSGSLPDRKAPMVSGKMQVRQALNLILAGTDLGYKLIGERTITVGRETPIVGDVGVQAVQLAEATSRSGARTRDVTAADALKESTITEIIVTAQKTAQRLQDVPVPVAVISARALTDSNQLRLQDYYKRIPGLSMALIGDGSAPSISVRGVSTGGESNRTIGTVVDEVAYGSTVSPGVAPTYPDVDPGDLARIEVLRGPQGTLYGASSIGGLLKFVTIDPSLQAMDGRVQAGFTSVEDGDTGYSLRGAINLPVRDTFAVRLSGFTIRDPGYVDNARSIKKDYNNRNSDGGRLSALWQPSENFSLKLGALYQTSDREGTDDVDTSLGNGLQRAAIPGTGIYNRRTQVYSATMIGKLGTAEIVSATGYSIDNVDTSAEVPGFASTAATTFQFPGAGAAGPFARTAKKFSQEVRATLPLGEKIQWLVGAYYTSEDTLADANYNGVNPVTGVSLGRLLQFYQPSDFSEYAAFSNLTFNLTDRFDIQLGGRFSENKQSFSANRVGPLAVVFYGADPAPLPKISGDDDAFTYLLTPRFKVSSDLMVYARFASGYRPGGLNSNCTTASGGLVSGIPCAYTADTTQNYEAGLKGNLLGGLLAFDASVYYIDWNDIQIPQSGSGLSFILNAGKARSRGVELSVETKPLRGMTLAAWMAYNDAELSQVSSATSALRGQPGDQLPNGSPVSGSFSLDQDFPLGVAMTGFIGGSVSYVDSRKGEFRTTGRVEYPAYTQLDLRGGVKYDTWTVNAFVNNLGDKRGILRSGVDALAPTLFTYIQPRTIGLSLAKTFQ